MTDAMYCQPLQAIITQCASLVEINLSDCSLTAQTMVAISEHLKDNKKMTAINFSLNAIGGGSKDNQEHALQFVENMEIVIR